MGTVTLSVDDLRKILADAYEAGREDGAREETGVCAKYGSGEFYANVKVEPYSGLKD